LANRQTERINGKSRVLGLKDKKEAVLGFKTVFKVFIDEYFKGSFKG
jgi:hypothetical protein